ncbi:hypothetical protein INT47_011861 [Mucor saturninus]|uniref:Uncharacterized protein n=1 Tax=Mucor saturninus TaxID=64648 RepID=A0A8H7V2H4_9FUNG|nr:hypothetical protein INT47_011861 [Mucor saturninus]
MSLLTTAFTILIIIPIVPLFAYVIGLLVPASHIVHRSSPFKISSKRLWDILINVNEYPQWQSKVEKVILCDSDDDETVFVEYSTRKRHTVIIHHERIQNQCLLRILEERHLSSLPPKIPTFSGSWTFEIIQEKEHDDQVTLKITEQGVIKKPMVRVTHLLLFGFFSRIDRFMNDLSKKIDADNQQLLVDSAQVEELSITCGKDDGLAVIEELEFSVPAKSVTDDESAAADESATDRSATDRSLDDELVGHATATTLLSSKVNDTPSATDQSQQLEPNDTLMTESRIVDKEWDLMSEIYERTPN